jgi:hypothetical protein
VFLAEVAGAETFRYVSFVKQIGKLLSFVLFLQHHAAV